MKKKKIRKGNKDFWIEERKLKIGEKNDDWLW